MNSCSPGAKELNFKITVGCTADHTHSTVQVPDVNGKTLNLDMITGVLDYPLPCVTRNSLIARGLKDLIEKKIDYIVEHSGKDAIMLYRCGSEIRILDCLVYRSGSLGAEDLK